MKKVRINKIEKLTHDVKRFRLDKPEGFVFTPGNAVSVAINKDKWIEKTRPFTPVSLNEDDFLEFIIKSYPLDKYPNHGGVTEQIHKLKVGDQLLVSDPWGSISYRGKGVFIAGGVGITPFIAIIRSLKKDNLLSGNKLIFSNKKKEDIFLEGFLKKAFDQEDIIFTLTREKDEDFDFGRVDKDFLKKRISDFSQFFYLCGPKVMVKDLSGLLDDLDVSSESLVFEK